MTQSTINPTVPVTGSSIESEPVRNNFVAAANDINNIYTLLGAISYGTMASQNANAVAITGGSIDSTTVGITTPAAGKFTNLTITGTITAPNKVTYAAIQQVTTQAFLGHKTGGAGNVEEITPAEAAAIMPAFVGDSGLGGVKGLVPAPAAGDAASSKFLMADGTWRVTANGGNVVGPASSTLNALARYTDTSGTIIKNSGVIVDDSNNITGIGNITANTFIGDLTGNADTADQVNHTLSLGAHLSGGPFNGSADVTIATDAASANTASTIVSRDASGNFNAGTITASLNGNASTVTTNANLTGPVTSSGNATSIANNIALPGSPTTTTQSPGDNSTKIATTAYVEEAVSTPTLTNTHIFVGNSSNLAADVAMSGDISIDNTGVTTINSDVALAGNPTTTTQSASNNSTRIATTAYVDSAVTTGSGAQWHLTGNSGTTPVTNFLGTTDAVDLTLFTNNTEKMRITSAGLVGIGTTTTTSTLSFNGTAARTIGMERNTTDGGNTLTINSGGALAGVTDANGGTLFLTSGLSTGTGTSLIQFRTYGSATSTGSADNVAATRMTINSLGFVGIGTTNPTAVLSLSGSRSGTPGSTGVVIDNAGVNFNDTNTAMGGTANNFTASRMGGNSLSATNTTVTTVTAASLWLAGVVAGTNETITNSVALYIPSGTVVSTGAATNSYGMIVSASTGATNNYAGYIADNFGFGGQTQPQASIDAIAKGVTVASSEQIILTSQRASIVTGNLIGGTLYKSNDGNLTAPGTVVAYESALAEATHTASVLDTGISWGTTLTLSMTEKMRLSASGNLGIGTTAPASKLHVVGAIQYPIVSVSTNTALDATHYYVVVDTTSGNITITLPAGSTTIAGRVYKIKNIGANSVIVARTGSDTIDGATSNTLASQYQVREYTCGGSLLWYIS